MGEAQLADPFDNVVEHKVVAPELKVTVPVAPEGVTAAEKVVAVP